MSATAGDGRLLIVNADDWGMDATTTERISKCVGDATVTSTSAMVHMAASAEAAAHADGLACGFGLHLNLDTPFDDPDTPDPVLRRQHALCRRFTASRLRRWLFDPTVRGAVDAAIGDQLDEFRRLYGREPTHLDGHHHVHMHPNVLLSRSVPSALPVRRSELWNANRGQAALRTLRWHVMGRRFRTPDSLVSLRAFSTALGGSDDLELAEAAQGAIVEVMAHPGLQDELDFLRSPRWRHKIAGWQPADFSAVRVAGRRR